MSKKTVAFISTLAILLPGVLAGCTSEADATKTTETTETVAETAETAEVATETVSDNTEDNDSTASSPLAGTYIQSIVEEYDDGLGPRIFDNWVIIDDDLKGVEIIQDCVEFTVSEADGEFEYDGGMKEKYYLCDDGLAIGNPDDGGMRIYTRTNITPPKSVTDYKNTSYDEEFENNVSTEVKPGVYAEKYFTDYEIDESSKPIFAALLKVNSDFTAETMYQDIGPTFDSFKAGVVTDSNGVSRNVIVRNDSIALENTPEEKEYGGEYTVFTLTTEQYPE